MSPGVLLFVLMHFVVTEERAWGSGSPPRVSVTRFDQKVDRVLDGCQGWHYSQQDQLRLELERELAQAGMRVLERQAIRRMYADEHQLLNLDPRSAPKAKRFLSAEYTITGGLTELGVCEDSSGTSVQLGGVVSLFGGPDTDLKVAGDDSVSRVKVVAQLVSVVTGEVVRSFEASGEISGGGQAVRAGALGVGISRRSRSNPPIERATNVAIKDLAGQISAYLRGV